MLLAKKKHRAALSFPFTHLFSLPRKGSELIQSSGERNREHTEDLRMSMVRTPAGIGLNIYKGLRGMCMLAVSWSRKQLCTNWSYIYFCLVKGYK